MDGRFGTVSPEKATGTSYTPPALADFVARRMLACLPPGGPARPLRLLDPAAGEGALLLALVAALQAQGQARLEIHGIERDPAAAAEARRRLVAMAPGCAVEIRPGDFLEELDPRPRGFFDLIIANPPYVRTQVMGRARAGSLARRFGLSGRVDLYQVFLLGMAELLDESGVLGAIVPNRLISTRGGATLRDALLYRLRLQHLWDLGDTKLFEEAVLPAVLLARHRGVSPAGGACGFSSIYAESGDGSDHRAPDVVSAIEGPAGATLLPDGRRFRVRHGTLAAGSVWRLADNATDAFLEQVRRATWKRFGDLGRIRVGVKTTADAVFIREDWGSEDERPELLRPLTTHHIARRYRADDARREILYPHLVVEGKRKAADLSLFPRSAAWLEQHRETLAARGYLARAGRQWFEIWVPQDPGLWSRPKLVFRDIAERPTFWIDSEGTVVNGDCYWMVVDESAGHRAHDLLLLAAAVGNSTFIERFYDSMFHNKLYAGRRRFITQYVEQFPLPDPGTPVAKELVGLVGRILDGGPPGLQEEVDAQVWRAFGLSGGG